MRPGLGGQTPAIALSSSIKLEESQAAFAYGFQQFLLKPIDLDDLVDAQGKRILLSKDFSQIIIIPACFEALGLHSPLGSLLLAQ
ncbi:hypothetical protein NDA01_29000, partial [Trichocoleus desertorum AS-A10]|uniref:hypothetical protein n=1 Tax=Trichocoleus desertorum TaxID=1481672 RepID=UPI003299F33D